MPPDRDYLHRLADIASRRADHRAVEAVEGNVTYAQLDQLTNQLAHRLIALGVTRETLVGISVPRGALELVAMLAVSKAGGAYVPLDPTHPTERLVQMVSDARPKVLLVHPASQLDLARCKGPQLIVAPDLATVTAGQPVTRPQVEHTPEQLAYVLFTSGSTGRPKGVEISQKSLLDYVYTFTDYFELSNQDVVIQQSSISFDTAVEEIYPILGVGGRLVLSESGGRDVEHLRELIVREGVTILSSTPLVIQGLNGKWVDSSSLRVLISGGDELKASYIDQLPEGLKVYNTYGPTESTVCATYQEVTDLEQVNRIGKPIANRLVYILNEQLQLQPVGLIGELYLGGKGLAKGYLHRPQLS
ncbi:MAG: AMP-binding protein, partial [Planctomycetes bacterium]|nr:AMP-binding protein [Planctomycetota bacterium]